MHSQKNNGHPLHLKAYLCTVELVGDPVAVECAKQALLALPQGAAALGRVVDMEEPGYTTMAEFSVGEPVAGHSLWPALVEASITLPFKGVTVRTHLQTEGVDSRIWVTSEGQELSFTLQELAPDGAPGELLVRTGDPQAWESRCGGRASGSANPAC